MSSREWFLFTQCYVRLPTNSPINKTMPRNKQPLATWLIALVCLTMLMCIGQRAVDPLLKRSSPAFSTHIILKTVDAESLSNSISLSEDQENGCTKNQKLLSYLQDHLLEQPALPLVLLFLLAPLLAFLCSIYRYPPPISSHERRLHLRLCNFRE